MPWSQSPDDWGIIDDSTEDARRDGHCLVCGLRVDTGYVLANLIRTDFPRPSASAQARLRRRRMFRKADLNTMYVADNGPMHEKCLLITRAHCKAVRDYISSGELLIRKYRT